MAQINVSSNRMIDIVGVIDEIAFQTHLVPERGIPAQRSYENDATILSLPRSSSGLAEPGLAGMMLLSQWRGR